MGQYPPEIFAFGHAFGDLREAATRYGPFKEGSSAFYRFLSNEGFSSKVAKQISNDPFKFAYSTFVDYLKDQKDPNF